MIVECEWLRRQAVCRLTTFTTAATCVSSTATCCPTSIAASASSLAVSFKLPKKYEAWSHQRSLTIHKMGLSTDGFVIQGFLRRTILLLEHLPSITCTEYHRGSFTLHPYTLHKQTQPLGNLKSLYASRCVPASYCPTIYILHTISCHFFFLNKQHTITNLPPVHKPITQALGH